MSHSNISIFVPHLGCPHQCSFCNQKHITGQCTQPSKQDVDNAVKIAMASSRYSANTCEIAFFGGSFTAIDRAYMMELLAAAYSYVEKGFVRGIRISTRPDCIDQPILDVLKKYGVTAIELGAQSMCDDVLIANERGHSVEDIKTASLLIKNNGFELGLQMMTGLYCSNDEKDIITAERIIALAPDTVRIYPTIVLENTALAEIYRAGSYSVPTLDNAVMLCAKLREMFEKAAIRVIRLGLHTIDEKSYVAGPWHPAFSELCDTLKYRQHIAHKILKTGKYEILVNSSEVSKAIGHKRSNITYFANKKIFLKIKPDNGVSKYDLIIKEVK